LRLFALSRLFKRENDGGQRGMEEGFLRVLDFPSMEISFCREGKTFRRRESIVREWGVLVFVF
jgi:hypothetical protein